MTSEPAITFSVPLNTEGMTQQQLRTFIEKANVAIRELEAARVEAVNAILAASKQPKVSGK